MRAREGSSRVAQDPWLLLCCVMLLPSKKNSIARLVLLNFGETQLSLIRLIFEAVARTDQPNLVWVELVHPSI